jgi:hypothetical protein
MKKVRPNQPLTIEANDWNRVVDFASREPETKNDKLPTNDPCIWVYASTNRALTIGAPVVLTAPGSLSGDVETQRQFDRNFIYQANDPNFGVSTVASGYPNGLVGVTIEPAAASGSVIKVAIGGIAWARFKGADFSGVIGNAVGFLDTTDSENTTHHRSFPLGHHLLLSRTAKGAFVNVNGNMQRGCFALADTSVIAFGSGTVKLLPPASNTPVATWLVRTTNRSQRSTTNGNILWIQPVSGSNEVAVIQEFCSVPLGG